MGTVSTILEALRKGPEALSALNSSTMQQKSVARGAKDSTLQFPLLISDTIPVDMATVVARTMERVYAGFVQTWLSVNQTMDLSIDPTPMSYLKKFHQNIKLESVIEEITKEKEATPFDIGSYMESIYSGEYKLYMNKDKTYGLLFNGTDKNSRAIMESHKAELEAYLSDFDLTPVTPFNEADSDYSTAGDLANALINNTIADRQKNLELLNAKITSVKQAPVLLDRDVKKSNDMMPFALQVRLVGVNADKQFVQYIDFIVGIKTVMHLIKSDDMSDQLMNSLKNRNIMFKFLRWTSGEISLFKNIILNLDDLKMDATATRKSSRSPWFGKLKRLKENRFRVRNLSIPTFLVPNSTIVISQYEVDLVKNKIGMDLRDPSIANRIVNDLFLMAFIIIDDGSNTIDILYDHSSDYETYTLETLQREVSITSNKLGREIGRMLQNN